MNINELTLFLAGLRQNSKGLCVFRINLEPMMNEMEWTFNTHRTNKSAGEIMVGKLHC
jgi:hypothetical protein